MTDSLYTLFFSLMDGVKADVHTCMFAILSILLIILGFTLILQVLNTGGESESSRDSFPFNRDDKDL